MQRCSQALINPPRACCCKVEEWILLDLPDASLGGVLLGKVVADADLDMDRVFDTALSYQTIQAAAAAAHENDRHPPIKRNHSRGNRVYIV